MEPAKEPTPRPSFLLGYVHGCLNPHLKDRECLCIRLGYDEIRSASELCMAAAQGNVGLIKRYILAGINVNAADYDKRTALHIAAADGCLEVVSHSPTSPHARLCMGHGMLALNVLSQPGRWCIGECPSLPQMEAQHEGRKMTFHLR
jgi:ankyrin repeat protein